MTTEREALARAIDDHLAAQDAVREAEAALEKAKAYAERVASDLALYSAHEEALTADGAERVKAALAAGAEPSFDLADEDAEAMRAKAKAANAAKATEAAIKLLDHDLAKAQADVERLDRERTWAAECVLVAEAEAEAEAYHAKVRELRAIHYRLSSLADIFVPAKDGETRGLAGAPPLPIRRLRLGDKARHVAQDGSILGTSEFTGRGDREQTATAVREFFGRLKSDPEAQLS